MPTRVRVQLLGPVRAVGLQGPLALRGKTARTVLARLALSAGTAVSADQLMDALWDDHPPLDPSASLRSIVSRLRRQLGREAIVTIGAGYRLDSALVDVDLREIEAALKGERPQEQTPEELLALLKLWDGDALADVEWTPAFEPERARIEELRARLLDARHEAMIAARRAHETLPDLERDAAAAPHRESTQLLLMRALDACGRTADAVRAGDRYRTRLIDHTGLDPSPDYDALALSLLSPDRSGSDSPDPEPPVVPPRAPSPRAWVPPDTPFVGRDAEVADLARLAQERRLVTVTGPGGVGKTRLVTEFMSGSASGTRGNVHMVSLATLTQASDVDAAVATALGLEVSVGSTLEAISGRLSNGASTLVLDNCEHILLGVRTLVQHLLQSVRDLRIIATSRRRLALADEAILQVGPLAVPTANTIDNDPMRLFMDRVQRSAPSLAISDGDRVAATDICRRLDGLPLALELAAVRVSMFGFDGLRQRLIDGLAIPGTSATDDTRRQATIESTVAWSLDLLSPDARRLFDDLTIFPSWFDLAGLEHVSGSGQAVVAFAEIHDTSLVVVDPQRHAYRLLEPVRQVARRQLDPELLPQIIDRYTSWVTAVIDRIEQHWVGDDCATAQQLIIGHRADIRWCLNHFIEQGDADAHGHFAFVLTPALVERADIELIALCRVEVRPSLEGVLAGLALAWSQGDLDAASRLLDEIGGQIDSSHHLWGAFSWAVTPLHLYRGDTDQVIRSASAAADHESSHAALRAQAVAFWALGLLYRGRKDEAANLMADREHILHLSVCSGFVAYTRAEIMASDDPELAISYLTTASQQATDAMAPTGQRLTDVARLALFIAAGQTQQATQLALRLIPDLTQAGDNAQAWRAMRHIADLLGQIDATDLALLVIESANTAPSAPAQTSKAIKVTKDLQAQAGDGDGTHQPMALGPLWEQVEQVLRTS